MCARSVQAQEDRRDCPSAPCTQGSNGSFRRVPSPAACVSTRLAALRNNGETSRYARHATAPREQCRRSPRYIAQQGIPSPSGRARSPHLRGEQLEISLVRQGYSDGVLCKKPTVGSARPRPMRNREGYASTSWKVGARCSRLVAVSSLAAPGSESTRREQERRTRVDAEANPAVGCVLAALCPPPWPAVPAGDVARHRETTASPREADSILEAGARCIASEVRISSGRMRAIGATRASAR